MGETRVPTEEEIASLPLWARVAFAARCARRVLPLFKIGWPDAPDSDKRAVADAVARSETAAHLFHSPAIYSPAIFGADVDDTAARVSETVSETVAEANARAIGVVATYAATAASEAGKAARAAAAIDDHAVAIHSANAAFAAFESFTDYAGRVPGATPVFLNQVRADFEDLRAAGEANGWDDSTRWLPPEVFGPLWPNGEPEGWPTGATAPDPTVKMTAPVPVPATPAPPRLSIVWDPKVVPPELYARLVAAIGNVVRAEGGLGLKRVKSEGFGVPAAEGVPS